MNLMLNMKDINKILANTHFKCKYRKNNVNKQLRQERMIRQSSTFIQYL